MIRENVRQLHQTLKGHAHNWWVKGVLLLLALPLCVWLAGKGLTNSIPAYEELNNVTGTYQALERLDSDGYRLFVRGDSGLILPYTIPGFMPLPDRELLETLKTGAAVSLRCERDEYRGVMELTVGTISLLRYDQARRAYEENARWAYGFGVVLWLLLLGAVLGFAYANKRSERRKASSIQAMKAVLLEREERRAEPPRLYALNERKVLEEYIRDALGPIAQVFHELEGEGILVDIAVIEPTERENFYRLVTIGMGARPMDVPAALVERNCAFGELCVYLPPDWKLLSGDPRDTWPFHWLKTIARLPVSDCDWLGVGHSVHTGPLGGENGPTELLLTWATVREGSSPRLLLPGGRLVNFYQLMPLYPTELAYYQERGFSRLWQRLLERGATPVVDMGRESCYDPETDFDEELAPFSWSRDLEEQSLSLQAGWFLQEHFERAGLSGSGYDWETLAQSLLHRELPQLQADIRFASDETLFCVYSQREAALRTFAFALRNLCDQEEKFDWLLNRMPEE